MAKKKKNPNKTILMPVVNSNAAGIDMGSMSHFVCVSQDNVKEFRSHTDGLHQIVQHLLSHKVKTVAMESTGFYWQQLFVLLQDYGFEVILVNARHVKNVKGHKTDVVDSKWLQLLHSIGLLSNSFQPDSFTKELQVYSRMRRTLIEESSRYTNRMYKSLVLMNIHLKTVLSDMTGQSGIKVIEAILNGERDESKLEKLVGRRVSASRDEIKKALKGTFRNEHLFELSINYQGYKLIWEQIKETDNQIGVFLENWRNKNGNKKLNEKYKNKKRVPRQKNDPKFDVDSVAYEMTNGVDLTEIEGVKLTTILVMMSETGFDIVDKFKTAKHFASWLGLAPNRKITGGKTMSSSTPKVKNPLSIALRMAANAAGNSKSRLGDFFRRIAYRKGRIVAITATARKISVIIYNMLKNGEAYSYDYEKDEEKRMKEAQIKQVINKIRKFNISTKDLNLINT